ncbi:MAG: pitrilysin family protein, partial [Verrucomicrobiota bacterium]
MSLYRFLLSVACIAAPIAQSNFAQEIDPDAPLPVNPAIRIGTLENGMKYYVRENRKPEGRAIVRLVVNVGSIQETEEQRGLAHFVEHMAFNGSENFNKSEVVDFMEEIGMSFGTHLNASTSFNETIYKLEFPMDDPEVVNKAFLILDDWASGIEFSQEEIDAERGVVIEEWRARKSAASRIREKQYPLTYYKSLYKDRLPIGLIPILETANRDEFLKFYNDWYRPDLMAVIAVGDFDGEEIERKIIEQFADIENSGGPERTDTPIPDHQDTLVSIEVDPELTNSSLSIMLKKPLHRDRTARDFMDGMVESMYYDMLNSRIGEKTRRENPPFQGAAVGRGRLGREKDSVRIIVGFLGDAYEKGINGVLDEIDRVNRDGFTQSEFERRKVNMLRGIERALAEKDKRMSSSLVGELIRNFTVEEPIPGIDLEMAILKKAVEVATLEKVNAVGK